MANILDRTEVNTQATLACDQSRPLVQVDALQPPGFGAEFLQQPQVETITAADVNNTRVTWKIIANETSRFASSRRRTL